MRKRQEEINSRRPSMSTDDRPGRSGADSDESEFSDTASDASDQSGSSSLHGSVYNVPIDPVKRRSPNDKEYYKYVKI